jgi:hypothetical protein
MSIYFIWLGACLGPQEGVIRSDDSDQEMWYFERVAMEAKAEARKEKAAAAEAAMSAPSPASEKRRSRAPANETHAPKRTRAGVKQRLDEHSSAKEESAAANGDEAPRARAAQTRRSSAGAKTPVANLAAPKKAGNQSSPGTRAAANGQRRASLRASPRTARSPRGRLPR